MRLQTALSHNDHVLRVVINSATLQDTMDFGAKYAMSGSAALHMISYFQLSLLRRVSLCSFIAVT
jgi:hypothetical protein